jgi:hypothetical protein
LRAMTRKPSCLISCSHASPVGGADVLVGRHGGTKPSGRGMPAYRAPGAGRVKGAFVAWLPPGTARAATEKEDEMDVGCAWLLRQGYELYRNVSQHGLIDMIAIKDGKPLL